LTCSPFSRAPPLFHRHSFPTRRSSDLLIRLKERAHLIEFNLPDGIIFMVVAFCAIDRQTQKTFADVLYGLLKPLVPIEEIIISRSEEHTSELQSRGHLVCRLLLEKKKK